jgi:RNA polymerase sigma factor (sigma-70 family)
MTEVEAVASVEGRIRQVAYRYASAQVPFEDLCQEGRIGALIAYHRFEPARGLAYITSADWWILQRMHAYACNTRALIRIPIGRQEARARRGAVPAQEVEQDARAVSLSAFARPAEVASHDPTPALDAHVALERLLAMLPARWEIVVRLHHLEDHTMRQIAGALALSPQRIQQIDAAALVRLRQLWDENQEVNQ